jgi:nitrile hydratase beta subunit
MNGVHDMGGMHGFGPIEGYTPRARVWFGTTWEARVCGMTDVCVPRYFNLDAFRYGIERMDPTHYLRAPYFERWLETIATNMIEAGYLTREELAAHIAWLRDNPGAEVPRLAPDVPERSLSDPPAQPLMPALPPRFTVGEVVVTRNIHPIGHTRLPRYARGKQGVIHRIHGPHVFADTNADGRGEHPQVVYNVCFAGQELWGSSAEPGTSVSLDLWESYLEPPVP